MHRAETALAIAQCALQKNDNLIFAQRIQHIDAAAREQRRVDLKRRIFGGRADQANAAFLDVREEGILLRFVEAVNLVDEDDGPRAVLPGPVGVAHDLLDFLDARENGGKLDEVGLGDARNNFGQSRLARARRPPEDHRGGVIALDLHAQRFARPDQMFLAHEFIQRSRTHAVGQRARALDSGIVVRDGREQIHKIISPRKHGDTEEIQEIVLVLSVSLCLRGDTSHFRFLAASYSTILAATPALSDSTCAACGMASVSSIWRVSSRARPAPSLPMKMASGSFHEICGSGVPWCDEVASRRTPCPRRSGMSSTEEICKQGKRKIEPAEPRRTFELYGLTVPSVRKTPAAPKASAERRIVPRLPGSCRPAATTNGPSPQRSSI